MSEIGRAYPLPPGFVASSQLPPALICLKCGAYVCFTWKHKKFHDDVQGMMDINREV